LFEDIDLLEVGVFLSGFSIYYSIVPDFALTVLAVDFP
jgi:hypothetical protein